MLHNMWHTALLGKEIVILISNDSRHYIYN